VTDVLTMLEADHRYVDGLLGALSESEEGPERERLVAELVGSLEIHMGFEEASIYPLLRRLDRELTTEGETEHQLTRDGLRQLRELVAAPGFGAAVDIVTAGIAHHVDDEETEAFPKLRAEIDERMLVELAGELFDAKRAGGVLQPELEGATKEQLVAIAQLLDVPGRSSMSADDLRAALAS